MITLFHLISIVIIIIQMANFGKEPNIKFIPSDPMTNTILIIYCVSSTGASVPYKSVWRRVHTKKNKVQEIKYHNGSSYRCSPLDIDSFIEATIYFTHQNVQLSRIIQSNIVKVSRQLKQKRMTLKEPIVARVTLQDAHLQARIYVHDNALTMNPVNPTFHHLNFTIPIPDFIAETEGNQMTFKLTFKQKFEQFLRFLSTIFNWRPQINTPQVIIQFGSDLYRDIILLGIAENIHKPNKAQFSGLHFPITARNVQENGKITARQMQKKGAKSPNKSQKSVSPANGFKEKMKATAKTGTMKNSFTGLVNHEKKMDFPFQTPTTPEIKIEHKQKTKGEYLNIFEDEDLQFLNAVPETPPPTSQSKGKKVGNEKQENKDDGPSINLRGSFEELEKSFNSNINEETIDRVFGFEGSEAIKKLEQELTRLRNENESLKKQAEMVAHLTKQSNTIKKKYLDMKEEVNRLEMEKKVILTDKLRCQVNLHKEVEEKKSLKKQIQHLKEMLKPTNSHMERSMRANSFHQPAGIDRFVDSREAVREINRSQNSSYYH